MTPAERPVLRSRVWPVAAGCVLAVVALVMLTGVEPPAATIVVVGAAALLVAGVLVWAVLVTRRQRRAYEDELTAWAAERATQTERLRIARDLHDLASHGLGLITVRAAAARTVIGPDGEIERAAALTDIERAGREATTELRRMLDVLRSPGDEAPLRPPETLADLPRIVAQSRAGGLTVTLDVAAGLTPTTGTGLVPDGGAHLSPMVQLAVCALVREALTNTARHSGPTTARVTVTPADGELMVTVTDDGPAPGWRPHPGAGTGLVGLRERVTALGGSLDAAASGAGYRLHARIPRGRP